MKLNIRYFLLILILLSAAHGCKRKAELQPDPDKETGIRPEDIIKTAGTTELKDGVYILDSTAVQDIVSFNGEELVLRAGATMQQWRSARFASVAEAAEEEIIVIGVTSKTPEGVLAKISKIIKTSEQTKYSLVPASLLDVFRNLDASFEHKIDVSETLKTDVELGAPETKASMEAGIRYAFQFDVAIRITNSTLESAMTRVTFDRKNLLKFAVKDEWEGEGRKRFFSRSVTIRRWIMIGAVPFPVIVTPIITSDLVGKVGIKGKAEATFIDITDQVVFGASYGRVGGMKKIEERKAGKNTPSFTAEMEGYAEAGIRDSLKIHFYNFKGLAIGGSLYTKGRLDASCQDDGKGLECLAQLGADYSAFVTLKALGWNETANVGGNAALDLGKATLDIALCKEKVKLEIKTAEGAPVTTSGSVGKEYTFFTEGNWTHDTQSVFEWDFGDGSAKKTVSGDNKVKHTFSKAGKFTLNVKIFKGNTVIATASRQVEVLSSSGGTFYEQKKFYTSFNSLGLDTLVFYGHYSQPVVADLRSPMYQDYVGQLIFPGWKIKDVDSGTLYPIIANDSTVVYAIPQNIGLHYIDVYYSTSVKKRFIIKSLSEPVYAPCENTSIQSLTDSLVIDSKVYPYPGQTDMTARLFRFKIPMGESSFLVNGVKQCGKSEFGSVATMKLRPAGTCFLNQCAFEIFIPEKNTWVSSGTVELNNGTYRIRRLR